MHPGSTTPCIVCRQKHDDSKLQRMRRIEKMCGHVDDDEEQPHFMWSFHSSCRYGIDCTQMRQMENQCNLIASRIERKLVAIAKNNNDLYHHILPLLQGYFPQVHHQLTIIHAKTA